MDLLLPVFLILFLVLLNGFFVASEFALVAVRKTRIDELVKKGNTAAKFVQNAQRDLDMYISATQFGITVASLALGWVGEPVTARLIEPLLFFLPHSAALFSAHAVAITISFSLITFLHIVLGELAPKTIALQRAERVALGIIVPLTAFTTLFKPVIYLLNETGVGLLSIVGLYKPSDASAIHTEEEVKMILTKSGETGIIPQKEVEMMNNVFRLGEIPVKHIMIPRTEIVAFSTNTTLSQVISDIEPSNHSRFPVYEGSIDQIIGFIHIKDIYKVLKKMSGEKTVKEAEITRDIIQVPETKKADRVLLDMRKKRIHIAVVNDEYGGTAGTVTLEDVIESLVGEIQDEFEEPENEMKRLSDGSYLVDGLTSLDKLQTKFDLALKGQGYTTIGGLVFGLLGREPKKDDNIQIGNLIFTIEEMHKKRIRFLKIKKDTKKTY